MADRVPVPERLAKAIAEARKDPAFADRIERLSQQDFNPLAVVQRGLDEACSLCGDVLVAVHRVSDEGITYALCSDCAAGDEL